MAQSSPWATVSQGFPSGPWSSVSDQLGGDSPAVRLYNVQKIPANFLIEREGNIVRRNVPPTEIEAAVKELL